MTITLLQDSQGRTITRINGVATSVDAAEEQLYQAQCQGCISGGCKECVDHSNYYDEIPF